MPQRITKKRCPLFDGTSERDDLGRMALGDLISLHRMVVPLYSIDLLFERNSLLSDRLESDDDQGKVKWENLVDIYLFFLYDRICIFQYFK